MSAEAIAGDLWKVLDREDDWTADAVLLITDVSGLLSYIGALTKERQAIWESVPVWHYCPIEGDNLPPIWTGIWNMFQPVAMSHYGARVIGDLMGTTVPMIYHGVDTEGFRPVSPGFPLRVGKQTVRTKDECKALFGISPDRKVLLRTDRNATRKFYYVLLEAFAEIAVAGSGGRPHPPLRAHRRRGLGPAPGDRRACPMTSRHGSSSPAPMTPSRA